MAPRHRPERPPRQTLPGIAKIRITADEATTQMVVDVLQRAFVTTDPSPRYGGGVYLDADVGNPAPDDLNEGP
ncbi:hypothetical protein [Streptomyces sp. NPDC059783]|uniref:hypothetical protein n=1 Tax=Streptomyces sp. NPDC059783 TaxID=3346944 RepID=UPI0036513B7F